MPPEPPLTRLDLLLVGGLTVDRFADGTAVPGGSVLHAARAARAAGARVGAIVTAGPEAVAALGLRELEALPYLRVERAPRSIGFEHLAVTGERRLRFDGSGGDLLSATAPVEPGAVLLAPVAGELGTRVERAFPRAAYAAILQGWLRGLRPGEAVEALALGRLSGELVHDLAQLDLLIASREDLVAEADRPEAQLDALRSAVGGRPAIVLTDATRGAWLDLAASEGGAAWRRQLPAPRIVEGVPSVGAGDMFAALLLMGGWPPDLGPEFLERRAAEAMRGVAALLEARR